jgi:hypothetical protein
MGLRDACVDALPWFGWLAIHETEPGHLFDPCVGLTSSSQRGRALCPSEREPCLGWGASTLGRGGAGDKGFWQGLFYPYAVGDKALVGRVLINALRLP